MKKYFLLIISLLCVVIMLCSCASEQDENSESTTDTSQYVLQSDTVQTIDGTQSAAITPSSSLPVTDNVTNQGEIPSEATENNVTTAPVQSITEAPTQVKTTLPDTTKKELKKTGEMAFSDSADNKYLAAVVQKYGVSSKNLAAIYTVPDNNGNLVLEFDGTTDADGKLIRNSDTLIAIYTVDKQLNCKRASEDSSLNEYSYGEMKVMFITTTKHIMPEFEEELKK